MALLSGDFDIPHVGKLPKAAVLIGVGGVIGLIIWTDVRSKSSSGSAAAAPAGAAGDAYPPDGTTGDPDDPYSTDPSTGETYGDEAASGTGAGYGGYDTDDSGYIQDEYPPDGTVGNPADPYSTDPSTGETYGDEGYPGAGAGTSGPPFSSNAAWSQYVLNYFTTNQFGDIAGMTTAIGLYLAGQTVNATQQGYINDATAIAGQPPVAGAGNFPPSIRVAGPTGGGTGPANSAPPKTAPDPVTVSTSSSSLTVSWKAVGGATQYGVLVNGPDGSVKADSTVQATRAVFSIATTGTNGTVKVRAGNASGWGPYGASKTFTFTTAKPPAKKQ